MLYKFFLCSRAKSIIIFFFIISICSIQGQSQNLIGVGDNAPELKFEKWMKGDSISSLEKGTIYVIDIWATWCTPCISGWPHLSGLQKKYKDKNVYVLGISSLDSFGNTMKSAMSLLTRKDTLAGFHFAWVPESVSVGEKARDGHPLMGIFLHPWMKQIGSMNMPTTFVVDREGRFAFIGDPAGVDKPLEELVNGTFSISNAAKKYKEGVEAEKTLKQFEEELKNGNVETSVKLATQLTSGNTYVKPNTLLGLTVDISGMKEKTDPKLLYISVQAAEKGVQLTQFESPGYLDALATAYAANGNLVQAIIAEKAAISISEGEMQKYQIKNLERYQSLLNK